MIEPYWLDEATRFQERGALTPGEEQMILWVMQERVKRTSEQAAKPSVRTLNRAIAITKLSMKLQRLWRPRLT